MSSIINPIEHTNCKIFGLQPNLFEFYNIQPDFLFKYKARNNFIIFDKSNFQIINEDNNNDESDEEIDYRTDELLRRRSVSLSHKKVNEITITENAPSIRSLFGTDTKGQLSRKKSFHVTAKNNGHEGTAKPIKSNKNGFPIFNVNSTTYLSNLFVEDNGILIEFTWNNIKKKGGQLLIDCNEFRKQFVMKMLQKIIDIFKCGKCIMEPTGATDLESDIDISMYGHKAVSITKTFIKVFRLIWGKDSAIIFDCNLYADSFYEPANISSYNYVCFDKNGTALTDKIYRIMITDGHDVYNQHVWGFVKVIMYITKYIQNLYVLEFNTLLVDPKIRILTSLILMELFVNKMISTVFIDKTNMTNNRLFIQHLKFSIKRYQNIILNLHENFKHDLSRSSSFDDLSNVEQNISGRTSPTKSSPSVSRTQSKEYERHLSRRSISFNQHMREQNKNTVDILTNLTELCLINLFCKDGNSKHIGINELIKMDEIESVLLISDNIHIDEILSLDTKKIRIYVRLAIEIGRLCNNNNTTQNETLETFCTFIKTKPGIVTGRLEDDNILNMNPNTQENTLNSIMNMDNVQQMNDKYSMLLNYLNEKKNQFTRIPKMREDFNCPDKIDLDKFDQTHEWIYQKSSELKDLMSLCNIHASETYLTQGSFFLIVVRIGKKQKIPITFDEILDCVIENIGETIKETATYISRHKRGDFKDSSKNQLDPIFITDRLIIKTSKYLLRVFMAITYLHTQLSCESIQKDTSFVEQFITDLKDIKENFRGKSDTQIKDMLNKHVKNDYIRNIRNVTGVIRGNKEPVKNKKEIEKHNIYIANQSNLNLYIDDDILKMNKYLSDRIYRYMFSKTQKINIQSVFEYCIKLFFDRIPKYYAKESDPNKRHLMKFNHNIWYDLSEHVDTPENIIKSGKLVSNFDDICSKFDR